MQKFKLHFLMIIILFLSADTIFAQNWPKIIDPAPVSLESLFLQADLVGFVIIHSGDARSYKHVVYKAEVVIAYKGAKENDIIYFTPYIGYGVGKKYLVFLKSANKQIGELIDETKKSDVIPYDAAHIYYRIMYQGYSVMPVSYECYCDEWVKCDECVRFNAFQVELPAKLKAFPKDVGEFDIFTKWVRLKDVHAALVALKNGIK